MLSSLEAAFVSPIKPLFWNPGKSNKRRWKRKDYGTKLGSIQEYLIYPVCYLMESMPVKKWSGFISIPRIDEIHSQTEIEIQIVSMH